MSGIDLAADEKLRYTKIQRQLSVLSSRFSNRVLDATQAWRKHITDENQLAGLLESAKTQLLEAATRQELDGWLITLDFPNYQSVMTYAQNRALREELYLAYCPRASDQGPHAGQNDNGPVMDQILKLRQELAQLLGFRRFSELSLATKMAESSDQVMRFLEGLVVHSKPVAKNDLQQLERFAADHGCDDLRSWDISFYTERLREQHYSISEETLRAYFPIDTVLSGLFAIVRRLYDIEVSELQHFDTWHPTVRLFAIHERGVLVGRFYVDLYARGDKRVGAWMESVRDRRRDADGQLISPVANLVCNFSSGAGGKPALLKFNEVLTLFHEFGHGLHHLLTRIEHRAVAGGVPWDAVELPSQFMENWCWQPKALAMIAAHHETGDALPQPMLHKVLAAKHFQSGMATVRQLELALFDFHLHEANGDAPNVQGVLNAVRQHLCVQQPSDYNCFSNSFGHIFEGGYAAGYYSYKWAELLSADAFSCFEEEGLFNADTGRRFRDSVLAYGGSRPLMSLFVEFRGRLPTIEALLRHSGLSTPPSSPAQL